MAVIREKTLKFPGLDNVYTFADEADLFDANVPCSAGEYRIYEGELYRCDTDHTGSWNYAHFTPVKLGNEVSTALAASVGNFAEKTIENVAIATFNDGAENVPVKSLIVNVDPVQNLHGYDNPWPAGGGKNLINVADYTATYSDEYYKEKATGFTLEAGITYTLSATVNIADETFSISVGVGGGGQYRADLQTKANQSSGRVSITFTPTAEDLTTYSELWLRIPRFGTPHTGTATVSNVQLELGSSVTDFAPYENNCPITGHTGANVVMTGKNLLNIGRTVGAPNPTDLLASPRVLSENNYYVGLRADNYYFPNYITGYSVANGTIKVTSTNNVNYGLAFPISCKPNTQYTISATLTKCQVAIGCYDSDWNFISNILGMRTDLPKTFSTPNGAAYITLVFGSTPLGEEGTATNIQLELSSTATAYEEYKGQTIPITFPAEAGTVYGGTLENHGTDAWKLRVDKAIVDLGTLGWEKTSHNTRVFFYASLVGGSKKDSPYGLCSSYKMTTNNQYTENNACRLYGSEEYNFSRVAIIDDTYKDSDKTAFASAMSGVQLVYELANPIEYTITAEAAKTLLGLNNIWADTGDIDELIYRTMNNTDAKIRLTKALIAPVLDDMVADTLLAANDFRVVGDTLYIITGSIASGSALIPGTNCTATTIGEQITALLNA